MRVPGLRAVARTPLRNARWSASASALGFAALGLAPTVHPILSRLGFQEPTAVQRQSFEPILSGGDTVVLAETGSGKTLAYALPIIHMMLAEGEGEIVPSTRRFESSRMQALLLQPNRELCKQARDILDRIGPSVGISISSLMEHDADIDADILIATPTIAIRSWRGPERVRWLVLDEADALLAGTFKPAGRSQYPVEQIIAAMKLDGKRKAEADGTARSPAHYVRGEERQRQKAATWGSKQFLFVGATMPNAGTKNMDGHVRTKFPTAQWVRTDGAHHERSELRQFFVKVQQEQRDAALRHALKHGPPGPALVFANTLDSAKQAYAALSDGQDERPSGLFHSQVHPEARAALLSAFAAGEVQVLVCTGLASRGIDFADVAHVVQYQVAPNAVEFMHRIGRTARAGKGGTSTCLYDEGTADLAELLRDATERGEPIDKLFSRKRSLRARIKKQGREGLDEAVGRADDA